MAVATETADIIKANVAVAFCGAIRLKLRKMTTSQNATTISSGFEMDEIDSATSNVRSWPNSTASVVAWALRLRCISSFGVRC